MVQPLAPQLEAERRKIERTIVTRPRLPLDLVYRDPLHGNVVVLRPTMDLACGWLAIVLLVSQSQIAPPVLMQSCSHDLRTYYHYPHLGPCGALALQFNGVEDKFMDDVGSETLLRRIGRFIQDYLRDAL